MKNLVESKILTNFASVINKLLIMVQYFKNISSLSDLKSQYRELALANHPDRGGKEEVMKAINAEYDRLYVIWVDREPVETRPTDTAEQSRHFYTPYGWAGSNYDQSLSTKEIAALVRDYAKTHWNQWKFSVRCHFASMCSEIRIELKGGPIETAILEKDEFSKKWGVQTSYQYHDTDDRIDPMAEVVMKDVVDYCKSFNYDDSDAMIDYFDTNFYMFENVAGQNDWKHITGRKARISASTETSKPQAEQLSEGLTVLPYSEKAWAVTGDTKPVKEKLKSLGGKFSRGLTVNGEKVSGWVFSRNRYTEQELRSALNI